MKKAAQLSLFILLSSTLIFTSCRRQKATIISSDNRQWTNLLDAKLSYWEKFIGVPHYSITTLPNNPKGDGMNGTPLGLNNDPLNVFKTEQSNEGLLLHISGEIYGGLTTKEEYGNYHLKMEFKWGVQKFEPRLTSKRDNGILYHCYGKHGTFWNVWMNSQEMQVQEGDMGDYFALGPTANVEAIDTFTDNEKAWTYMPGNTSYVFGDGGVDGRCRRMRNYEHANGQWNVLELICLNGKAMHVINGHIVMVLESSRVKDIDGQIKPLTKGRIQIQSEGAEAFYRNMQIRDITELPEEYR